MDNPDYPEVLAVLPLPQRQRSPKLLREDRRGRQTMLARLLLVAIDMTLAGEPFGLETARDLIREVRHAYPELLDEWNEI